jgi:hypothetical protein
MVMTELLHPAASHHLPSFITAPGETDVLMVIMGIFLALAVLMFGILFFRLHTLPERIAHKSKRVQFEIVAVLGLISLFTHMHIFWIAGLLLAFIDLPDFGTPLARIAASLEKISGKRAAEVIADGAPDQKADAAADVGARAGAAEGSVIPRRKAESAPGSQKEQVHA